MKKYVCTICGFVYDELLGIPSAGILPGTKWEDLPEDWVCPLCGAAKADFIEQVPEEKKETVDLEVDDSADLRELTDGELSVVFFNLAKGCEKQYLDEEAKLFLDVASYFKDKVANEEDADLEKLLQLLEIDLGENYQRTNSVSITTKNRGAQRALVWSEKVSRMINSILTRYISEGESFLENTKIFVCETCGFVYVGDNCPNICPVCKVPNWKINQIERR